MTYKEFLAQGGEKKWQDKWLEEKIDRAEDFDAKPKKYVLDMFPYPSGAGLHVGHPEGYTATDIYSRYLRLKGFNVLHPMGWDAFGLPAENYAITTGTHPRETTEKNIATFKRQIQSLGFSYDWDREIDTTDPNYYRWTQWIFLQLFKKGLAYEAIVPINFCPSCQTGLANEEVKDGQCERCGTVVERRDMRQWMLKITAYADRLLAGLDNLDWPQSIKTLQKNWIGRSEGAAVKFPISNSQFSIEVYTTRPDTLFGATYMVLSPEHELIQKLKKQIANFDEVEKYISKAKNKSDLERTELNKEKTGVELKGIKAVNPVNNTEIPIWVSDYVLASYGTGAIMAVPAHDERDFEFAKKFDLPIIEVIIPERIDKRNPPVDGKEKVERQNVQVVVRNPQTGQILVLHSNKYKWNTFPMGGIDQGEDLLSAAAREVLEETGYKNLTNGKVLGGQVRAEYFANHKDVNRVSYTNLVQFDLADEEQVVIPEEEKEAENEILWKQPEELTNEFMVHAEMDIWQERIKYGDIAYTDVDSGVMINSEFLDGLAPSEAIGKMTAWLEEKGFGKQAVNYKLRDWVFSRQRYWGEPMPIVYCESCRNKKQKVLMIHGLEGTGEGNWFPWVKQELEKQGFEVFNPTMATSDHPILEKWLEELVPYIEQMGENDMVVGHSLGAKAALHLIEKANKKIKGLYLVAPVLDAASDKEYDLLKKEWVSSDIELLKSFSSAKYSWERISNLIESKNVIFSDDDPFIKIETKEILPVGWNREVWHGFGHFQKKEIPELLNLILRSKNTGWVAIPENELPLILPEVKKYEPTGTGESPLANINDWVEATCPKCGQKAKRETNTMPQWAGSSWYWLRYLDPKNENAFADRKKMDYWLPVDLYLGGAEHAVLHLLYARFWNMVLFDLGYLPQAEPFAKLVNQGLILGEDGEKMSKSRGNVINPDDILKDFGADAFRMYEMFMGPLEAMKPWSTKGIVGIVRFLDRVWNQVQTKGKASEIRDDELEILFNKTIKKIGEDIEKMNFNTAISALMILLNKVTELKAGTENFWEKFLIILSPFAPHLAEELWEQMGNRQSIFKQAWPQYDKNKIKDEETEIAVQINGKVRAKIKMPTGISESEAIELAKGNENVQKYLAGQNPKKVIFVAGKLLSLVI